MAETISPSRQTRPSYNPSSWGQRIQITVVALAATLISLYLGLYQWGLIDSVWDPLFQDGTAQVLTSPLSHEFTRWIRIPDAILGVFAYFSDMIFAVAGSTQRWQDRPWLVILFGINVIPIGIVSILLVILQGLIVKFWCFLCLIAALISMILIVLAYGEVLSSLIYLHEIRQRGGMKEAWQAFWGNPTPHALEAGEAALKKRSRPCGPDLPK